MKLTVEPFAHQKRFMDFSDVSKFTLCGDEMGLGKTLTGIGISCNIEGKTMVVCPAFLKYNWKAEFLKFTDIREDQILIINRKADVARISKYKVIIVNYARLEICETLFEMASHVIADEAHYLKNLEAKRTQLFYMGIKKYPPTRLTLLSGTPVTNRVPEFYSLLLILEHKDNGKKITDSYRNSTLFAKHFSHEKSYDIKVRGRRVTITKYIGLRNEVELKTYFRGKYIRRLTKDVIDLPELLERYVDVQYKYNDKDMEEFEKHRGKIDDHIMAVKKGSAVAKAPFTADYAKNIHDETGRPVVIFSDHVDPVNIIAGKLKSKVATITGKTPMSERQKTVERFQNGELDYLVATIGAASTGITLTEASDLVFNDMSYVPANNAQASKRIHRIGQDKVCRIHKICGSKIDIAIMTALTSKQETLDKIL